MHVGMSTVFQSANCDLPDHEVYQNEVHLADLAEPLGYESIWGVEHHFTDYTMCPDPIQYLSYMAGRTEHVQLGTMVVVLPWHDPMRVAEEVSMLDNLSNGRMILGIGRGLARVEYQGFRLDMVGVAHQVRGIRGDAVGRVGNWVLRVPGASSSTSPGRPSARRL